MWSTSAECPHNKWAVVVRGSMIRVLFGGGVSNTD